jgi:hypothetical protein
MAMPSADPLSNRNLAPKLQRNRARRARVRVAHIEFSLDVARDDGALLDDAGRCRARSDKLKDRLLPTF